MPMKYPEEFKRDVVRVARSFDGPLSQVARDFGVSQPTLSRWISESRVDDGSGSTVSVAEFRAARERIRALEEENEILRRAAAYLSQANLKLGQSPK